MSLENAILKTLAYSDIFDYPLTIDELQRYLGVPAAKDHILLCIGEMQKVNAQAGYYFITGREEIVGLRRYREKASSRPFKRAILYGRILGKLPFIRMVALTGSLAVRNCDETGDYDYMLVAKPGRVWLARAFALLLNRIARLFGETLCPNLIISENVLEWTPRNLYTAREICQMVLISGEDAYRRLRVVNKLWIEELLPNIDHDNSASFVYGSILQIVLEFPFRGKFGNFLESWEMNRKVARFAMQAGYGLETKFGAEVCQGNFDHHGSATLNAYYQRIKQLRLDQSLVEV